MYKYFWIFIAGFVLLIPNLSFSDEYNYKKSLGGSGPEDPFDYELPMLPPYCACRLKPDDIRYKKKCPMVYEKFKALGDKGQGIIHIHHYCGGLLMLSRVSRGLGDRTALLKTAEGEFNYMLKHSNKNFILMPEILLNMGKTKKLLGEDADAIKYFYESLTLNKKYTPAYIYLANLYIERKEFTDANKIVNIGLKYSPNNQQLRDIAGQLRPYDQKK